MRTVKVRVFASHPVAWKQYYRILASQEDFHLVEGDEPYVVGVFDGELGSLDALITLARLKDPSIRPLLLWRTADENNCLRWLLRGVCGVVSYDCFEEQLCEAIRRLAEGQFWLPASVLEHKQRLDGLSTGNFELSLSITEREQQVMDLMLRRLSNKEIAAALRISTRTVKFHVGNVLHKLRVNSRQDLFDNSPVKSEFSPPRHPLTDTVPEYS